MAINAETLSEVMFNSKQAEQDYFTPARVRRAAQQISYGAGAEQVRDTFMNDGHPVPTEEQAYLLYIAAKLFAGE